MPSNVEIEDIEEMRRQEGIDDAELRTAIRALKAGDFVKLTFLTNPRLFQTVEVRITRIQGCAFRGRVLQKTLTVPRGKLVAFTPANIHSVV